MNHTCDSRERDSGTPPAHPDAPAVLHAAAHGGLPSLLTLSLIASLTAAIFEWGRASLFPVARIRCVTDALFLLLVLLAAAALFGVLSGAAQWMFMSVVRALGNAVSRRIPPGRARGLAHPLLACLLFSPYCIRLVLLLFSGRGISRIPHRALLVACASVLAVLAAFLVSWAAVALAKRLSRGLIGAWGRRLLVLALFASALCLYYIDATCYIGLYRYVHRALAVAVFLLVECAWAVAIQRKGRGDRFPLSVKYAAAALFCAAAVLFLLPRGTRTRRAWNRVLHLVQSNTTSSAALFRTRGIFVRPPAYRTTGLPTGKPFWTQDPVMSVLKEKTGLPGAAKGMNLVIITVDALRADHLGCHGYPRDVSPNIDRIAREGIIFRNAYAPVPCSFFSIVGLMTSRYGSSFVLGMRVDAPPTLADILDAKGYETGGFFSPLLLFMQNTDNPLTRPGLGFGDWQDAAAQSEDASFVHSMASRFIHEHRTQRFFAWAHFLEPHYPFVRHEEFDFGPSPVDRYDSEIAYVDSFIGKLASDLARDGLWDRTVILVTADHGEGMGEHGSSYHGVTLYEEETHVACILRVPGVPARVIDAPIQTIDLTPTLLTLLGLSPGRFMQGADLGPLIAGKAPGYRGTAFSEVIGERIEKRMVRRGRWKLIHDLPSTAYELYDLAGDPKETRNMYGEDDRVAAGLRDLMARWSAHQYENTRALAQQGAAVGDDIDRLVAYAGAGDIESIRRLLTRMGKESSPERLRAMLNAIGSLERILAPVSGATPPPIPPDLIAEASRAIRPLLDSKDGAVRDGAGWTLAKIRDARAVPFLVRELGSGRTETRHRAAHYLGLIEDRAAVGPLRAYFAATRTDEDRRESAIALGRLGDTTGLDTLLAILGKGFNPEDRASVQSAMQVVRIIGALKDRRATQPLCAALLKEDWFRDSWYGAVIVGALGEIGDPSALPVLEEIQRTTNFAPCREAADSAVRGILGRRGDQSASPARFTVCLESNYYVPLTAVFRIIHTRTTRGAPTAS